MKILAVFLLLALSSCASLKKVNQPQIINTFTVEKPFEEVWKSIIGGIQAKGIPIKNIEKSSGLIATDDMKFNSMDAKDRIICDQYLPTGAYPFNAPGILKVNYFVNEETKKSTKVTMNVFAGATVFVPGNAYVPPSTVSLNCYSTGKIEQDLYESIK
jgi:hypothetical protein